MFKNNTFPQVNHRIGPLTILLFFLLAALLAACAPSPTNTIPTEPLQPETFTPTVQQAETQTNQPTDTPTSTATATPFPLCTPPPCKEDEAYYCEGGDCPGGCGTTCATHTPTATEIQPSATPQLPANVQDFPDPASYQWTAVASGLSNPLGLVDPGDGSGRLFILEQAGTIRILQNGELLPTPFLDIRSNVGSQGNEQGLLGLAFHPDFGENGLFFINYTDLSGDTVVSRFQVSGDPDIADPGTENPILQVQQPYQNHNGGHLLFGPDGYLYIGLGDGGARDDPRDNAQNASTMLGSMLRLDIDNDSPYAIPPDNPYVNGGGLPEIWAIGLRNPWRFSFDRITGDLYIGDVGQDQWEEIHFWAAGSPNGANFGWPFWEGTHQYRGNPPGDLTVEFPISEYNHTQGCSVTGGFVYRGSMPAWQGIYIYADYCSGRVWGILRDAGNVWQTAQLFDTNFNITSFGEDQSGEIYLVDRSGSIYQLTQP